MDATLFPSQHPWLRLFFAYTVTLCNFIIYAEDPVAHSEAECFIPVVGNCFAFVFTRYPRNGWAIVKVLTWLIAILMGMIVGKLLVHKIVLSKCLLNWYHDIEVLSSFQAPCEENPLITGGFLSRKTSDVEL